MTEKEIETVLKATEGLKFKMKVYERGDYVEREFTVGKKCAADGGQWVCTTHGKAFDNQLNKDMHISDGKHTLAWHCFEHGPEVP